MHKCGGEQLKVGQERIKKSEDHIAGKDEVEEEICAIKLSPRVLYAAIRSEARTRTVDEYTEEFDLLTMRYAMAESDEQTIARYTIVTKCLQVSCNHQEQ